MMDIRTAEATIAAAGNIEAAVSVASNLVNSEFVAKRGGVLLVGCSLKKFFRTQIEYLGNHLPDNQTHDYFKVLAFDEKTLNVVYASSKEKTYLNIVQGNEQLLLWPPSSLWFNRCGRRVARSRRPSRRPSSRRCSQRTSRSTFF
jgi:hypothetical protein